LEEPNLVLSTIKKAEKNDMILARLFNGANKTITIPGRMERYRLNETLYGLRMNETLEPGEICTLLIK